MDKKKDRLLLFAILAGTLSAIASVSCYLSKKWAEVSMLAECMEPPSTAETLSQQYSTCEGDVISE